MTFIDNSAKTNWKFIGVVSIAAILVGGAVFLFLNSSKKSAGQLSQQTTLSLAKKTSTKESSVTVSFIGEVSKGESFEKVVGKGLVFRLNPTRDIEWIISIEPEIIPDQDSSWNFAGIVTPPYRGGVNNTWIDGWQFRNSDNSGPLEWGSLNAPGKVREFFFVLSTEDYQKAQEALDKMLWPGNWSAEEVQNAKNIHEELPKGVGRLTIKEMELGNLIIDEKPWIELMEFESG